MRDWHIFQHCDVYVPTKDKKKRKKKEKNKNVEKIKKKETIVQHVSRNDDLKIYIL